MLRAKSLSRQQPPERAALAASGNIGFDAIHSWQISYWTGTLARLKPTRGFLFLCKELRSAPWVTDSRLPPRFEQSALTWQRAIEGCSGRNFSCVHPLSRQEYGTITPPG